MDVAMGGEVELLTHQHDIVQRLIGREQIQKLFNNLHFRALRFLLRVFFTGFFTFFLRIFRFFDACFLRSAGLGGLNLIALFRDWATSVGRSTKTSGDTV